MHQNAKHSHAVERRGCGACSSKVAVIGPRRPPKSIERRVVELRRQRLLMATIAAEVGIGESTVSRILQRHGPNRLSALDPKPPVQRYEHATPGSMPHLDIKKPGRFARPGHRVTGTRQAGRSDAEGWDYGHVAIDDHARVGFARIWPDESAPGACNASIACRSRCPASFCPINAGDGGGRAAGALPVVPGRRRPVWQQACRA